MDNFYNLSKYIGLKHIQKFQICSRWANEIYLTHRDKFDLIDSIRDPYVNNGFEQRLKYYWPFFVQEVKKMGFSYNKGILTAVISNVVIEVQYDGRIIMITYVRLSHKIKPIPATRKRNSIMLDLHFKCQYNNLHFILYSFDNRNFLEDNNIFEVIADFKQLTTQIVNNSSHCNSIIHTIGLKKHIDKDELIFSSRIFKLMCKSLHTAILNLRLESTTVSVNCAKGKVILKQL